MIDALILEAIRQGIPTPARQTADRIRPAQVRDADRVGIGAH